VSDVRKVESTGVQVEPGSVRYDASRRELRIVVKARAGSDAIVNIALVEPLE
jgi:hypothetical protein